MDPFVAEVRIIPTNFAPRGWAFCNGQILPLSQNTALFSLLGTTYGGNGSSNFALPNLQGMAPMHPGQGSGLSLHDLGETGGSETETLLESEIPAHNHNIQVASLNAQVLSPSGNVTGRGNPTPIYANTVTPVAMGVNAIAPQGGNLPHNNMQPYLVVNFCIALQGVFPPRG